LIGAEEAFERMGADVMRWMYCAHPPDRNLLFGYAGAHEVQRRLLTLWNSARFLTEYGNIEGFTPSYADLDGGPQGVELQEIDRWLLSRAGRAVREATAAFERWRTDELIEGFESYLDDLSNWYIRRSRRRFYGYDEAALRTLWVGVVTALRIVSPIMPFLTEHLWQSLVSTACEGAPESVHLAGWPVVGEVDLSLLDEMETTRRIVEAGRRARTEANIKLRQPLRKAVIRGGDAARGHVDMILEELRLKEIDFDDRGAVETTVKPNYPVAGPRLGPEVKKVAEALLSGEYELHPDGTVEVAGVTLTPEETIRTERVVADGWLVGHDGGLSIAIDPTLDESLISEGRALDLVRSLNEQRKTSGFRLTDRIHLRLPVEHADLLAVHGDWIASEVLAVSLVVDDHITTPVMTVSPG
jgi:isoleucyl-tRNA synthetase